MDDLEFTPGSHRDPLAVVTLRGSVGEHAALKGKRVMVWMEMPSLKQLPRDLEKGDVVVGNLKPDHEQSLRSRGIEVYRLHLVDVQELEDDFQPR